MATRIKNRSTKTAQGDATGTRELVLLLASLGIDEETIGRALDPPCAGAALKEMYRDEWALRRQNFLLTIGKAMKELLEGRPAKYDKKGRPISSEIRPNPTTV